MLQLSVLYEVMGEFWEIDPYNAQGSDGHRSYSPVRQRVVKHARIKLKAVHGRVESAIFVW